EPQMPDHFQKRAAHNLLRLLVNPLKGDLVDLLRERDQLLLKLPPRLGEKNILLLEIALAAAARDIAELDHFRHRRMRRRLGQSDLDGEVALRHPVPVPHGAEENPVAERHAVIGKPRLQGPIEPARQIPYQMRDPVIRIDMLPMRQYCPGCRVRINPVLVRCSHDCLLPAVIKWRAYVCCLSRVCRTAKSVYPFLPKSKTVALQFSLAIDGFTRFEVRSHTVRQQQRDRRNQQQQHKYDYFRDQE